MACGKFDFYVFRYNMLAIKRENIHFLCVITWCVEVISFNIVNLAIDFHIYWFFLLHNIFFNRKIRIFNIHVWMVVGKIERKKEIFLIGLTLHFHKTFSIRTFVCRTKFIQKHTQKLLGNCWIGKRSYDLSWLCQWSYSERGFFFKHLRWKMFQEEENTVWLNCVCRVLESGPYISLPEVFYRFQNVLQLPLLPSMYNVQCSPRTTY